MIIRADIKMMEPLRSQSRLDIMIGSMFSGKSSALLRKLCQLSEMGLSALYINHTSDTRAATLYSTHSPLLQDQTLNITTIKVVDLQTLSFEELKKFDVLGLDEAQFFDKSIIEFVKELVEVYEKYVIVVGLDGDFERNKFGYILDLIPLADNVTKLHAYCKRCAETNKVLKTALFSHYSADPDPDTNVIIGGSDKYTPVCRSCYLELH